VKLLVSWLRDLVDVPVPPATLATDLHMMGFEVASVEPPPGSADTESDAVIDFEITANRPDCLSVVGLAREVATRYGTALHAPAGLALGEPDAAAANGIRVTLEEPTLCPRYCAAVADVRVGPSPDWLRFRLEAAGVRAINNIVDVTNYVLLECGQPMHAFDLARIEGGELRVRLAQDGERLRTLDGQDRVLQRDMLVIADARRATALAGIMGGAASEVTASTQAIVFESAWFDPGSVRRTSRRLGLSTEASYRFERGADIEAASSALARACALLEQIGAGRVRRPWIDAWPIRRPRRRVRLESGRVEQILGVAVEDADIDRILTGLGFDVDSRAGGTFDVVVPSWRVDVSRDVDLVEDVARLVGYDRLPTTFPELTTVPAAPDRRLERDRLVRRVATAGGFTESVTFSFIPHDRAAVFAADGTLVEILNPLSEQFAVLRPSLLHGLLESVAHNRRRGQDDVQLFELGTIFGGSPQVGTGVTGERRALGLAWTGAASRVHWSRPPRAVDFFDMKGFVEALAQALGTRVECVPCELPFLVPGRTARIELAASDNGTGRSIGFLGLLLPSLADTYGLPAQAEVYVAEIDLDGMLDALTFDATMTVQSPPRYPAVVRDISVIVEDTLPAANVRGTIRAAAPPTLVRVGEFDRYQGKGVPEGRVSLSYRLTFQAADRTLTDAEVQRAMDEILAALARTHGAVQR
jgi:phenylalanyl-tRNA synthetase beta chain